MFCLRFSKLIAKNNKNMFASKFRLLNSQEPIEEISWSSSESSDYENVSNNERYCNITNKNIYRKRKRKDKTLKNISNLDVTIIDVPREQNSSAILERSPIISRKSEKCTLLSPILKCSPKYFPPFRASKDCASPNTMSLKSPILIPKHASPKVPMKKIKKRLFNHSKQESTIDIVNDLEDERKSPIFAAKTTDLSKRRSTVENAKENPTDGSDHVKFDVEEVIKCEEHINQIEPMKKCNNTMLNKDSSLNSSVNTSLDDSILLKTNNNSELVKKVKSFFDCQFSSENPSQHSIVETQTPTEVDTKSIDDIEIISSLTQATKSNKTSFESVISNPVSKNGSTESYEADFCVEKSKKIRYKKDGLAYRLNTLLKKQVANISLWQHEKYLAENSSFVIPKAEFSMFRIKKCNFKYGCYLIETVDENDESVFILINGNCLGRCKLSEDCIFKLYQPYIVLLDLYFKSKLIVNVCKFECVSYL